MANNFLIINNSLKDNTNNFPIYKTLIKTFLINNSFQINSSFIRNRKV